MNLTIKAHCVFVFFAPTILNRRCCSHFGWNWKHDMNLTIKAHCVFVFSCLQSLIGDVVATLVLERQK